MNTIEKMARELFQAKSKICVLCKQARFINEKSCPCPDVKLIEEALTAYESEKSLLEKTADWHSHGTVAPSCVGCPTAEAMIKANRYVRVDTARLQTVRKIDITRPDGTQHTMYGHERILKYLRGSD